MLPRVAAILTWADVRVQVLFGELKFSVIESQYFTGPVSVVGLWVCTFLFEWDGMVDHGFRMMSEHVMLFTASATLGLCVNFSSLWVTQTCSALTLQIVVTLRNIVIVIASVALFGEVVQDLQIVGYILSIVGMWAYKNSEYLEQVFGQSMPELPSSSLAKKRKNSEYTGLSLHEPGRIPGRDAAGLLQLQAGGGDGPGGRARGGAHQHQAASRFV